MHANLIMATNVFKVGQHSMTWWKKTIVIRGTKIKYPLQVILITKSILYMLFI